MNETNVINSHETQQQFYTQLSNILKDENPMFFFFAQYIGYIFIFFFLVLFISFVLPAVLGFIKSRKPNLEFKNVFFNNMMNQKMTLKQKIFYGLYNIGVIGLFVALMTLPFGTIYTEEQFENHFTKINNNLNPKLNDKMHDKIKFEIFQGKEQIFLKDIVQ